MEPDYIRVFELLFAYSFDELQKRDDFLDIYEIKESDLYVFYEIYPHISVLDQVIQNFSLNWSFERIGKVELALARLGLYLLLVAQQDFQKVSRTIKPLVKLYCEDQSYSYLFSLLKSAPDLWISVEKRI